MTEKVKKENQENQAVVRLDRARREIAAALDVQDVKDIRDKAEALRVYQRQAGASLEIINDASEIKLRAERRAGEILRDMEHRGERARRGKDPPMSQRVTLPDLGISRNQSSRWQAESKVSDEKFEQFIREKRESGQEITQAGLLSVARREGHQQKRDQMASRSAEARLHGFYSVVLADPPWQYGASTVTGAAADHYPTMATSEVCAMPIRDHLTEDAALFLWATAPMLPDALRVCAAWGFDYKTAIAWVKHRPTSGLGVYVRGQFELVLIGIRGSFQPEDRPVNVIRTDESFDHSRKPDALYELIEEIMYPGQSYLELFARRTRDGWTSYGNELGARVEA